jgi:hypothetical protein
VSFAVMKPGTLLFAEPYDGDWSLDGRPPVRQLGLTCAFRSTGAQKTSRATGRIEYWNVYIVAGYALSALGLIACILMMFLHLRRKRVRND